MSDSDRFQKHTVGLIAAIIVLLTLAIGYSKENEQDFERSKVADTNNGQPINQFGTPRAGIPAIAEAAVSNPEPEKFNEREKRELAAQESMAVWGFWSTFSAFGTMFITLCGTVLIWRQISLTRQAVEDTGKATEEMRKQTSLTKDNAEKQLRAYIGVFDVEIVIDPKDQSKILAIVKFANQGQTPAIDLHSGLYISVTQGTEVPITMIEHPISYAGSKMIVESGGKREISHSCTIAVPPAIVMTGDYTVCAYGWFRYHDIFEHPHETRHCHLTNKITREAGRDIAAAASGNSMT